MSKLYSLADFYLPNDGVLIKRVGNSCFIFAPLPSDPLGDIQHQILRKIDAEVEKRTDPDRFHITLLYIEDCSSFEVSQLVNNLMLPIQFEVELSSLEILGDDPAKPALVWSVNPGPTLLRLQSDLYSRAVKQSLPISPFSKPEVYKPHVTVAYLKGVPQNVPSIVPFNIPVSGFKVSRDDYEVIHTIQLPTGRGNGQPVTGEELRSLLHGETIAYGPQRRVLTLSDGPFSLRHGTHQGQAGVEGKQGGSAEGFTHGDAGGKESGKTNTKRKDSSNNFGAKKELFNKPHHVPFHELDNIPDGEDFAELFDQQSEWEYPANEIVSSMISDATYEANDGPEAFDEAKEEMVEERMQDTLDEMYNQAKSYEDLPIPPEQLVTMGDDEIEDRMRDLAIDQARVNIEDFEVDDELGRRAAKGQLGFQDDEDIDYKFARNDNGEIVATSMSTWIGSHEGIVARYEDVYIHDQGIEPPEDLSGEQWFEVGWLASKEHGKGYGTQMMGEIFQTAASEDSGVYLNYLDSAESFYETFNPTMERNERIAIWTPLQVQELATDFAEDLEVEKSLVGREALDEIDISIEGSKRNEGDLEPMDGAFTKPVDWNKLSRKWGRKIRKEIPQFISAEDQAVFDARKKAERKQRGVEEDQFLTDVLGKRSIQDEVANLFTRLATIFRHGKHEGQAGRKGERGGSQEGFTHVGAEGEKESIRDKLKQPPTSDERRRQLQATAQLAVANKVKDAEEREPELTAMMQDLATEHGGEMVGLEFAVRSEESMARKVLLDAEQKDIPPEEAALDISDANRYTVVLPTENYVEDALAIQKRLEDQGLTKYDEKWRNYFGSGDNYDGYNTVVQDSEGNRFELQFHTAESIAAKQQIHPMYEEFRALPEGSPRRATLDVQMTAVWETTWNNSGGRPTGWEQLPGVMMGQGPSVEPQSFFHGTGAEAAKSIMDSGLKTSFSDKDNWMPNVIYAATDRRDALNFAARSSEEKYAVITIDSSLAGSEPSGGGSKGLTFSQDIPPEAIVKMDIYSRGFQRKDDELIETIERSSKKSLHVFVAVAINQLGYSILGPEKNNEESSGISELIKELSVLAQ